MATPARTGALAAAAGWTRAAAWAPDWRGAFARALAREVEERRFFLWIPVAAMGGVALNLAADREPVLWLPALDDRVFAALAWFSRARPFALGLSLAIAALFAGFLSMSLRTARVAAPVLDRIRIVTLQGFVEEVDLRTVGARMVIGVVDADGMPQRRFRAGCGSRPARRPTSPPAIMSRSRRACCRPRERRCRAATISRATPFSRRRRGRLDARARSSACRRRATPAWRQRFDAAIDQARNRLALRVNAIIGGDEGAIAAAMVTGKRDFLSNDAKDLIREAGIFHIITISGVQMTLVAGIFFVVTRRLLALSPTLALNYPIKKWAAAVAMAGSVFYDIATGSRVGTERALIMTLIVLGAVIIDRRALTMRNLAFAVLAVVAIEPEAILGVSFQLSFAAVAALVAVMEARLAGAGRRSRSLRAQARRGRRSAARLRRPSRREAARAPLRHRFRDLGATASFMAYHFHDLSPYVLIGNPLTLTVIEFFAVPGALLGAALYPLGLDGPVWLYVGAGIKFILWVARFIAQAPGFDGASERVRALRAAVPRARGDERRRSGGPGRSGSIAIPLALIGLVGASQGPRYDVIVAPSGDLAAVRDADGALEVVGKRFNAFAAEQWLTADGDGRDPAQARALRTRPATVSAASPTLPEGESLSIVLDRLAFDEDCARAEVVVSALTAPAGCKAKFVFDEQALGAPGAVGLTWSDDNGFTLSSRPQPAREPSLVARAGARARRPDRAPGLAASHGADPADAGDEPASVNER